MQTCFLHDDLLIYTVPFMSYLTSVCHDKQLKEDQPNLNYNLQNVIHVNKSTLLLYHSSSISQHPTPFPLSCLLAQPTWHSTTIKMCEAGCQLGEGKGTCRRDGLYSM